MLHRFLVWTSQWTRPMVVIGTVNLPMAVWWWKEDNPIATILCAISGLYCLASLFLDVLLDGQWLDPRRELQ